MTNFFDLSDATDETYSTLRDTNCPRAEQVREVVCKLWEKTEQYLDGGLRKRATIHFQQAFWEIYLCAALLEMGLPVTLRDSSRESDSGPDIQVGHGDHVVTGWLEAIAVTPGSGTDAVTESPPGQVRSVPHDAIKLRLTSALKEKADKFQGYCSKSLVLPDEPRVVAINAALVPSARRELDLPRIVTAVLPFGWPAVEIDVSSGTVVDSYYTRQSEIVKANGALVSTDTFESTDYSHVSAVLYSLADPFNLPPHKGAEFVLVHNPNATTSLSRGWIARGREYWVDSQQIRWVSHEAPGA